ncbi:diguanylate cyclase domain-containing protein [Roseateles sp.]|uniref:diguanylate cyclase domain-containing protein n=1 Tax=Roseateles sp. TaxID=1971397 RepID=UPI0032660A09
MAHLQMIANDPPASARSGFTAPLPWMESLAALGLRVSRQFAQCRRDGEQIALLWVEVEVLEAPGSALSDDACDGIIQAVSQRLRNRVRGADEVLRIGPHCFAVLLMAAGAGEADIAERRLLQTVRGNYGVDDRLMQVGVRMGTAVFPEDGRNGAELAEAARANLR